MKIRVLTTTGIKYKNVDRIQDYITNTGKQYSIAFAGKRQYKVIDRDYEGAIWQVMQEKGNKNAT